ncbi:MAG: hypothetical protein JWO70_1427, partial [Betaproteobacteria bacterium]|nr:hypothetical protein [Betaproteobacteria bacterium]
AAYEEALLRIRREHIGAGPVDAAIASLTTPTDHEVAGQWIANFIRRSVSPNP